MLDCHLRTMMNIVMSLHTVPDDLEGAIVDIRVEDARDAGASTRYGASSHAAPVSPHRSNPIVTLDVDLRLPTAAHALSLFVRVEVSTEREDTITISTTTTTPVSEKSGEW
jgi:hypothetical protein